MSIESSENNEKKIEIRVPTPQEIEKAIATAALVDQTGGALPKVTTDLSIEKPVAEPNIKFKD